MTNDDFYFETTKAALSSFFANEEISVDVKLQMFNFLQEEIDGYIACLEDDAEKEVA